MGHRSGTRVPIILYGSHNDFAQTNVTPELIDAGTGGFTEVLRNRVVLPFTGSYEDLRHVVVHELMHAFMFDMLYGGSAASLIARQSFFSVPLWFAEGMAEYFSLGMESERRDVPARRHRRGLPAAARRTRAATSSTSRASRRSATWSTRYGEERLRDVLQRIRADAQLRPRVPAQRRHVGRASSTSSGGPGCASSTGRRWRRKEAPEEFARRLTDHRHDESNLNTSPAVSPQGDRIAYFSDRRQYTDVYLMSALDGKVLRRVIRGERNVQFESDSVVPQLDHLVAGRRSVWRSPRRAAAATCSTSVDAEDGKVDRERFELPCDALFVPGVVAGLATRSWWSGVSDGRSDLWLVDAATGA